VAAHAPAGPQPDFDSAALFAGGDTGEVALLGKSLRGGLISCGGLNLSGTIDPVANAVSIAELAIEKGATELLIPVSARQLRGIRATPAAWVRTSCRPAGSTRCRHRPR